MKLLDQVVPPAGGQCDKFCYTLFFLFGLCRLVGIKEIKSVKLDNVIKGQQTIIAK